MPGPIVQAQTGGTCPRAPTRLTPSKEIISKVVTSGESSSGQHPGQHEGRDAPIYVKGASAEANLAYGDFLTYMEQRRAEARDRLNEDEEGKRRAEKRERSWHLLRESICYLEKNSEKWRQRRLKEVDKVKQEDEADKKQKEEKERLEKKKKEDGRVRRRRRGIRRKRV